MDAVVLSLIARRADSEYSLALSFKKLALISVTNDPSIFTAAEEAFNEKSHTNCQMRFATTSGNSPKGRMQ